MRHEGMEPFIVTDQATQLAPEPSQFESPPVAGRLFVDKGAGVCEPCGRAEAEAIDVDHITDGVRRWCEADTDFLLGTVKPSGQIRLGERASCSGHQRGRHPANRPHCRRVWIARTTASTAPHRVAESPRRQGGHGLADNTAVLGRWHMVHLIDDQQTEAVEASARYGRRVEGGNGQVAHLASATTYNADGVPWQAELLAHGALPLRQQLDSQYHDQRPQR